MAVIVVRVSSSRHREQNQAVDSDGVQQDKVSAVGCGAQQVFRTLWGSETRCGVLAWAPAVLSGHG
ncbi:MAG: hypothetical protein ACRDS9_28735 [Pseudonocardiaceae bacterium]